MAVKKIAFCNLYKELNHDNFMFRNANAEIGDDLLAPFMEIKRYAETQQIEVATVDVMNVSDANAVVFIDMPQEDNPYLKAARSKNKDIFLLMLESKLVRNENYSKDNHVLFKKIFTYDDSLVDGTKFIKINYSYAFPASLTCDPAKREKLCTMIAGNKSSRHPQELYSQRLETIKWFEENHPESFDLYGVGWNKHKLFDWLPDTWAQKIKESHVLTISDFASYKGRVVRKRDVMGRYRFAFCYENIRDVPGYVTEKIFDALFSCTVPIYLGANNVADHIPSECFIDRRNFLSYDSLYDFLQGMDDNTYCTYLNSIEAFLQSPKVYPFTIQCFARTIMTGIINE